jgi:hypothetical protein
MEGTRRLQVERFILVLILAFGLAFVVEGLNRCPVLFLAKANEGSTYIYTVRLLAFLLILGAIIYKNYGRSA